MSLASAIIFAFILIVIISFASELLALGSEVLEHKFGPSFVGSVLLGFITMLPELIFVLVAIREDQVGVAVGSAVGGNILLFTVGYGLVIALAYYKHHEIITLKPTMKDDLWYLVLASLYLLVASFDGKLTLFDGYVLTIAYFVFVIHQYFEAKHLQSQKEESVDISNAEWGKSIAFMVIGGIIIVLAAEPFVGEIVDISHLVGISAVILALIISPLASEMPEKISAFMLTKKSMTGAEMAISNFIGSKVQASTLLFGGMILFHIYLPNGHNSMNISEDMFQIFLAVFTTIIGVAISYDLKLKLKEGWIVLSLYVVSLIAVFTFSTPISH